MNKRCAICIANSAIPLLLGFLIYVTAGRGTYLADLAFRTGIRFPHIDYPLLIRCYACDFLWGYSLLSALLLITKPFGRREILKVMAVAASVAVLMESLQAIPAFPGTFDAWDIAAEFAAIVLCTAITHLIFRRKQHEETKID